MGTLLELPVTSAVRSWSDIAEAYRRPTATPSGKRSVRRPTVSVCIVANRPSRRMQAMIDSILGQRFQDLEIVVVGNATLYIKRAMLARPADERLRIIRTDAVLSPCESFNLAVRHSRGRFVKLLSPDATLHPDVIAEQVKVLESNHGVALVSSGTEYTDDAGRVVARRRPFARSVGRYSARRVVKTIVLRGDNPIGPLTATMFRRTDFRRCGAFTEDFATSPELDLWIRLLRFGDFFYLPEPVLTVHESQDSPGALTERRRLRQRLVEWSVFRRPSTTDRIVEYLNCCLAKMHSAIPLRRISFRSSSASNHASTLTRIGEHGNVTSIVGR
ncbi:glycosyltransferase family 2 protein [Mycobacterium sp. URHB0021]